MRLFLDSFSGLFFILGSRKGDYVCKDKDEGKILVFEVIMMGCFFDLEFYINNCLFVLDLEEVIVWKISRVC